MSHNPTRDWFAAQNERQRLELEDPFTPPQFEPPPEPPQFEATEADEPPDEPGRYSTPMDLGSRAPPSMWTGSGSRTSMAILMLLGAAAWLAYFWF